MNVLARLPAIALLCSAGLAATASAQPLPEPAQGFLCCNMRSNGDWISDSNYDEGAKTAVVPFGTPLKAQSYGRYRIYVEINGKRQAIGNDYSRDLAMDVFAKRYVVAEDPRAKLASASPKIRKAVEAGHVTRGMTRAQVLMAVGYPISSENPNLEAGTWRYWLSSFAEFDVVFDNAGQVKEVVADNTVKRSVWED